MTIVEPNRPGSKRAWKLVGIGIAALTIVASAYWVLGLWVSQVRLERSMATALETRDEATIADLACSEPSVANARDRNSRTPLHWASAAGRIDVAARLLEWGADVNAKDKNGWTPLHWAAASGRTVTAELLLAKGADINAKNEGGRTPLHLAAWWGHKVVVEFLITVRADITARDKEGKTALRLAVERNHDDVAEVFRKANAGE